MTEPDEETVRRWQYYTTPNPSREAASDAPSSMSATSGATTGTGMHEPGPASHGATPAPTALSARQMAVAGTALLSVLALVAILITWPPGAGDGNDPTAGPRPAQPAENPNDGAVRNLVAPQGDVRSGQGTVISGVQWARDHEPEKMIDGRLATDWRETGSVNSGRIRFELGDVHRITQVALALPPGDSRPITHVTWIFPDTSVTVPQTVRSGTNELQTLDVGEVTTSVVVLRLDDVGAAPVPEADFTGISEVQIIGS